MTGHPPCAVAVLTKYYGRDILVGVLLKYGRIRKRTVSQILAQYSWKVGGLSRIVLLIHWCAATWLPSKIRATNFRRVLHSSPWKSRIVCMITSNFALYCMGFSPKLYRLVMAHPNYQAWSISLSFCDFEAFPTWEWYLTTLMAS